MLSHERLPDECGELRVRSRFSGRIVSNPEVIQMDVERIGTDKSASVYERIASISGRAPENRKLTKCA